MKRDNYSEGLIYERFIIEAFGCSRGLRYGADSSLMKNLISLENEKISIKHFNSFEKQLSKVKLHITYALMKLSKKEPLKKTFFVSLISEIENSNETYELIEIIELAFSEIKK